MNTELIALENAGYRQDAAFDLINQVSGHLWTHAWIDGKLVTSVGFDPFFSYGLGPFSIADAVDTVVAKIAANTDTWAVFFPHQISFGSFADQYGEVKQDLRNLGVFGLLGAAGGRLRILYAKGSLHFLQIGVGTELAKGLQRMFVEHSSRLHDIHVGSIFTDTLQL